MRMDSAPSVCSAIYPNDTRRDLTEMAQVNLSVPPPTIVAGRTQCRRVDQCQHNESDQVAIAAQQHGEFQIVDA